MTSARRRSSSLAGWPDSRCPRTGGGRPACGARAPFFGTCLAIFPVQKNPAQGKWSGMVKFAQRRQELCPLGEDSWQRAAVENLTPASKVCHCEARGQSDAAPHVVGVPAFGYSYQSLRRSAERSPTAPSPAEERAVVLSDPLASPWSRASCRRLVSHNSRYSPSTAGRGAILTPGAGRGRVMRP